MGGALVYFQPYKVPDLWHDIALFVEMFLSSRFSTKPQVEIGEVENEDDDDTCDDDKNYGKGMKVRNLSSVKLSLQY